MWSIYALAIYAYQQALWSYCIDIKEGSVELFNNTACEFMLPDFTLGDEESDDSDASFDSTVCVSRMANCDPIDLVHILSEYVFCNNECLLPTMREIMKCIINSRVLTSQNIVDQTKHKVDTSLIKTVDQVKMWLKNIKCPKQNVTKRRHVKLITTGIPESMEIRMLCCNLNRQLRRVAIRVSKEEMKLKVLEAQNEAQSEIQSEIMPNEAKDLIQRGNVPQKEVFDKKQLLFTPLDLCTSIFNYTSGDFFHFKLRHGDNCSLVSVTWGDYFDLSSPDPLDTFDGVQVFIKSDNLTAGDFYKEYIKLFGARCTALNVFSGSPVQYVPPTEEEKQQILKSQPKGDIESRETLVIPEGEDGSWAGITQKDDRHEDDKRTHCSNESESEGEGDEEEEGDGELPDKEDRRLWKVLYVLIGVFIFTMLVGIAVLIYKRRRKRRNTREINIEPEKDLLEKDDIMRVSITTDNDIANSDIANEENL